MPELVIWLSIAQNSQLQMNKKPSDWMKYSSLGIQMVVSLLVFLYLGKWLGSKCGSETIGSLIGVFFGLFGSIYSLIKEINNS